MNDVGPIKCDCEKCDCETATTEGVCYECVRGLHATPQWNDGIQVRDSFTQNVLTDPKVFNDIDSAYADDLMPMVVPREYKETFSDPKFCEWFRQMCKHWYKLGMKDGGDSA